MIKIIMKKGKYETKVFAFFLFMEVKKVVRQLDSWKLAKCNNNVE